MGGHLMFMDIVKTTILHKFMYRFCEIPNKIQAGFYGKTDKPILKFICQFNMQNSQNSLEKEPS